MKHYYITTEQPIVCNDEEVNVNDWITDNQRIAQVNVLTINDPNRHLHKKIIAGLPNQPTIDYSALSDEDCKVIGWVDANSYCNKVLENGIFIDGIKQEYNAQQLSQIHSLMYFAFKTAQSLNDKKWSDEDVINLINNISFVKTTSKKLNSNDYQPFITDEDGCVWTINKKYLLSILKKTNQPKVFEIEAIVQDNKVKILKVL